MDSTRCSERVPVTKVATTEVADEASTVAEVASAVMVVAAAAAVVVLVEADDVAKRPKHLEIWHR